MKRPGQPEANEPICPISFEVATILLGGGPDTRSSFWKVYHEELKLNRETGFINEHVRICLPMLANAAKLQAQPVYLRDNQLIPQPDITPPPPWKRPQLKHRPAGSEGFSDD